MNNQVVIMWSSILSKFNPAISRKEQVKAKWEGGISNELLHWEHWLRAGSAAFVREGFNDYEWRTNPNSDLTKAQKHIIRRLEPVAPPGTKVSILDVGAGPLTCVGKQWEGREIKITAVDALAEEYNALLAKLNISPLVRT